MVTGNAVHNHWDKVLRTSAELGQDKPGVETGLMPEWTAGNPGQSRECEVMPVRPRGFHTSPSDAVHEAVQVLGRDLRQSTKG